MARRGALSWDDVWRIAADRGGRDLPFGHVRHRHTTLVVIEFTVTDHRPEVVSGVALARVAVFVELGLRVCAVRRSVVAEVW